MRGQYSNPPYLNINQVAYRGFPACEPLRKTDQICKWQHRKWQSKIGI